MWPVKRGSCAIRRAMGRSGVEVGTRTPASIPAWWSKSDLCRAALAGDPLYPLARIGPVVPAHPGDDREQTKLSGRG